jgi:hypothetical protein
MAAQPRRVPQLLSASDTAPCMPDGLAVVTPLGPAVAPGPGDQATVVRSALVGVSARYVQAVGQRAVAEGWSSGEVIALLGEVERRTTVWLCASRLGALPVDAGRCGRILGRRHAAICRSGRWVAVPPDAVALTAHVTRLVQGPFTVVASVSGGALPAALRAPLRRWFQAGARGGRDPRNLADQLRSRWALELAVVPSVAPSSLSAIREQVASAPRCGWCRMPVLGDACTRCLPETLA